MRFFYHLLLKNEKKTMTFKKINLLFFRVFRETVRNFLRKNTQNHHVWLLYHKIEKKSKNYEISEKILNWAVFFLDFKDNFSPSIVHIGKIFPTKTYAALLRKNIFCKKIWIQLIYIQNTYFLLKAKNIKTIKSFICFYSGNIIPFHLNFIKFGFKFFQKFFRKISFFYSFKNFLYFIFMNSAQIIEKKLFWTFFYLKYNTKRNFLVLTSFFYEFKNIKKKNSSHLINEFSSSSQALIFNQKIFPKQRNGAVFLQFLILSGSFFIHQNEKFYLNELEIILRNFLFLRKINFFCSNNLDFRFIQESLLGFCFRKIISKAHHYNLKGKGFGIISFSHYFKYPSISLIFLKNIFRSESRIEFIRPPGFMCINKKSKNIFFPIERLIDLKKIPKMYSRDISFTEKRKEIKNFFIKKKEFVKKNNRL